MFQGIDDHALIERVLDPAGQIRHRPQSDSVGEKALAIDDRDRCGCQVALPSTLGTLVSGRLGFSRWAD
jgi:hypothetical protein